MSDDARSARFFLFSLRAGRRLCHLISPAHAGRDGGEAPFCWSRLNVAPKARCLRLRTPARRPARRQPAQDAAERQQVDHPSLATPLADGRPPRPAPTMSPHRRGGTPPSSPPQYFFVYTRFFLLPKRGPKELQHTGQHARHNRPGVRGTLASQRHM